MDAIRSTCRAVAYLIWSLGVFFSWVTGKVLTRPFPNARRSWRRVCLGAWGRGVCWIVGIRVVVEGTPPVAPPFLLVSNHLSYLDVAVLGGILQGRFIAKKEVATWPLMGLLVRSIDTVFVDRENPRDLPRVSRRIGDVLDEGDAIMFFPEGTSSGGEEVLPFMPSLFQMPAECGFPVHYASLTYRVPGSDLSVKDRICWWGDMSFLDHFLGVLKIPRFEAHVIFGAEPIQEKDRKELARKLHKSVQGLFIPVVNTEETCR